MSTCLICHAAEGHGQWQVCDGCRAELVRLQIEREAAMAPPYCLGCFLPRRLAPVPGQLYCPRCAERYGRFEGPLAPVGIDGGPGDREEAIRAPAGSDAKRVPTRCSGLRGDGGFLIRRKTLKTP